MIEVIIGLTCILIGFAAGFWFCGHEYRAALRELRELHELMATCIRRLDRKYRG